MGMSGSPLDPKHQGSVRVERDNEVTMNTNIRLMPSP
jgi:hypothetical protein